MLKPAIPAGYLSCKGRLLGFSGKATKFLISSIGETELEKQAEAWFPTSSISKLTHDEMVIKKKTLYEKGVL